MKTFYLNKQKKTERLILESVAGDVVETIEAESREAAVAVMKEKYYWHHKPGHGYFL